MVITKEKLSVQTKSNPDRFMMPNEGCKSEERLLAEIGLSATTLNASTAKNFTNSVIGETHLSETIQVMREKVSKVNAGDLKELEATLTAQSVSLDAIFNELARRAIGSETMSKLEIYMRLSLKAQAQCARTIEVLAAMKNPPIVYAKQANFAHVNQQVNNGNIHKSSPAHTEKIANQPNELLESNHGFETVDGRATQTTINQNKAVATMAT